MDNLFNERIKSARMLAGLSLRELAEKIEGTISYESLRKYENGEVEPNSTILIKLSQAMNVSIDYFFRPNILTFNTICYRKKTSLSVAAGSMIKAKSLDFLERYVELENILNIKEKNLLPEKIKIRKESDIDKISSDLRNRWNIGEDPINSVIGLLEDKGIKIMFLNFENNKFDGLSACINGNVLIVINKNLDSVRIRFDALHELAHLMFDFDEELTKKEKENICHAFAGAFLMPKNIFIKEFGERRSSLSLKELIRLKKYFGASIQAIIKRARYLDLIDMGLERAFFIKWNQLNYRINEPGEYEVKETPHQFRQLLFKAFTEGIITESKAANLNNQSILEFRREVGEIYGKNSH